jgi:hypothetical protein
MIYSADMSWDARAWASLTGIAAGWLQYTENPTYVVGCEKCGFFFCRVIPRHEMEEWGDEPYEDIIEEHVWKAFSDFAQEHNCPHIADYLRQREQTEWRRAADHLGLQMAMS